MADIFSSDFETKKELAVTPDGITTSYCKVITTQISDEAKKKGEAFAKEITERFVSDFEKPGDMMAHVSTFIKIDGVIYMTYYANTSTGEEDPKNQTARLVYCDENDVDNKVFIDIQTVGEPCGSKTIDMVYDTILMQKDEHTIYVLWTARADGNYYRLYRSFDTVTKTLGEVKVNRFKCGNVTNDFSASGIRSALAENGLPIKRTYSDIGIMQKLSSREENGTTYYYTGAYTGAFTCIIKSCDLETWEYVSQPDFANASEWENATYVIGNKCFYFVRQFFTERFGFLTVYNLDTGVWEKPLLVEDCQSRGDFIMHNGNLYLFHAPTDREHIGILKVNTDDISRSEVVLQAHMDTSCFYPFVQHFGDHFAMSYTIARKHIRLAEFSPENYLD